jgi:Fe-S oxidoreductase
VLGAKIAQKRVGEAVATGVKAIVASCPSCMFNLIIGARDLGLDIDVFDLSDLVALSMGIGIRGAKEVAGIVYKVRDSKQIPVLEKEIERWEKIITPHT